MADITFTGNKTLKRINNEWCTKFPHLYLRFYDATGKVAGDWSVTHASIRAKKDAKELSTNAGLNVGTFEKRYEESFGVKIEIMHIRKHATSEKAYRSLDENNNMSLNEYDKQCAERTAVKVKEAHPEWF